MEQRNGGEVVGTVTHSNMVAAGSNHSWGFSVWSVHVPPVHAWVLSGFSGFLPPSKNVHVSLISPMSECECAWLFISFVSVWPCDGLAICPSCILPLAKWQLG